MLLSRKACPRRIRSSANSRLLSLSLAIWTCIRRTSTASRKRLARSSKNFGENIPNTPILLLTGLAEGTDRIAAYAARKANPPIDYVAVLPMPEDLYREDFETDSDREFQEMLRGAVRQIVLPLRDRVTPEDLRNGGPVRDEQYARMGEFLVKYSQILIAIWDGRRNGKRGGTSEVVGIESSRKTFPGRMAFSRMNHGGAGPVYEIAARRISSGHRHFTFGEAPVGSPQGS